MSYITIEEYVSLDIDSDDILHQFDTEDLEKELNKRRQVKSSEPNSDVNENGYTRELKRIFDEILNDDRLNHHSIAIQLAETYLK